MKHAEERKKITRHWADHERREVMAVEFIGGGPLDGMRLFLDVVREGPNEIRVLEMAYHRNSEAGEKAESY